MTQASTGSHARFEVENVGGIDRTAVELPPGVTVLAGRNATNRTSFLQSIMAAMGSDQATLKGDATEGQVTFTYDGQTYERSLKRTDDGVVATGEGFLDDPSVADLFSFLLETNAARQAVWRGADLRELIMEPVDVAEIKAEIRRVDEEKQAVNDELATIESLKRDLPELEQRRTELREQIAEKRDRLEDLEAAIADTDIEETRKRKARLEETLSTLRDRRAQLDSVRDDIDREQRSIDALKRERSELETELDELETDSDDDITDIEARIETLRREKRDRNAETSDLQSVISFNEEMLEETDAAVLNAVDRNPETMGDITNQLLEGQRELTCWTCGSAVETEDIERTLDQLRTYRQEKLDEVRELESELEELKNRKRSYERDRERRQEIEAELAEIETELSDRTERLADLKERRDTLTAAIDDLEATVEELETDDVGEVLELHREANELEFDIEQLEGQLETVAGEIEEKEAEIERETALRERRAALVDELEELRTRIDRIERDAVDQFNRHMDEVLDILDYDNLERIWIERLARATAGGDSSRHVFELHVVRTTETGAAYEDTVDHLSESEREVTGLTFALAGYLVHELHETVPFMLLDSLEAIDSQRIARLVDYFGEYADHLVVALLPEDAQALDDDYHRVTDI